MHASFTMLIITSSYVCSQTAGLICPLAFIRCEVMSTLVPVPSGVYFRHVLTAWSRFQIHKPSDKCSPHFPNDVPTCSPHRSPPPPILFFSCVHVCFYRREVTSSQLSFLSLPLVAPAICRLSGCLQAHCSSAFVHGSCSLFGSHRRSSGGGGGHPCPASVRHQVEERWTNQAKAGPTLGFFKHHIRETGVIQWSVKREW